MKIFYYEKSKINTIIIKYNLLNQHIYKDTICVKSLKKVETNSLVIIYKLSDLGNSTFQILKNIFDLFSKNINIHIYSENFFLYYNNSSLPINILKEIHKIEEYKKLTEKIIKSKRYMDDKDTYLQMLRFKRADIEKNAVAKYDELERILDNLGNDISNMIIFVLSTMMLS